VIAVRRAELSETETILRILNEAAAWLSARGVDQWEVGQWKRAKLDAAIARGETYLAWDGTQAVGTVTLQWIDELFWPDRQADTGYVHRLAVSDATHGRHLGRDLLRWAEATSRDAGKRYLRLDCACDNSSLRAYYESLGFGHRGDRTIVGGPQTYCGSLFEKDLS